MFANRTRMVLTFREDVLGRARVFPWLKLAEPRRPFTDACRSGEIRPGGGWTLGGVLAERSDERRRETFCREDGGEGSLGNAMLNDVLAVSVAGTVVVVIATILGAVELLREAVVAVAGR
jgi:hypothetical protein